MPKDLGGLTSEEEMRKHGPAWGLNPIDSKIISLSNKGMTPSQIAKELRTTSTYVSGVLSRNPRYVEARPSFLYAHETVTDWEKFKKEHPAAIVRSVTAGNHVLRVAYWGHVSNGRHTHSQLQAILHPRGESDPCAFMAGLRKSGHLEELLRKGRLPLRNISPFSGKGQYLPCPICSQMNVVSRANLRMRCQKCGTPLMAVRVRRK